jgi:hypothetical protein
MHGNKGKELSIEHRKKLSKSHKGQKVWNKGKTGIWSASQRQQISEFMKTRPVKTATRIKMSNKAKGRKLSGGHIEKLIKANTGRKATAETRLKLSKSHMGKNAGNKNGFWKGGVTDISRRVRGMAEYSEWRLKIFERDNYTCLFCNKHGVYLNADHYPILFSEIMKSDKISTLEEARMNERLWDINNGRTLCKECHLLVTFNKI